MDIEQPELGAVGIESATVSLEWSWETGWRARTSSRQSGSGRWVEHSYSGRDEAELHAVVSDTIAEWLGLV